MTILWDGRASLIGAGPWTNYNLGPWGETSSFAPDNNIALGYGPRRCTLVQDPLGEKGQVIKSTLLSTDKAALSYLPESRRSELAQTTVLQPNGQTFWIRIDTLILDPWPTETSLCPCTIWQIHDTLDAGDAGRRPPFEVSIEDGQWVIRSCSALIGGLDSSGQVVRKIIGGNLSDILGSWQSWVLRAHWEHTTGGELTLWLNRRKVFQEIGPKNCGNDLLGCFTATGVYCPVGWPQPGIAERVCYTTGMVIGDSAETFESFTGQTELEQVFRGKLALA